MRLRSNFDPAPLNGRLENRARGLQAALPDILARAGRLVAISLATSAQPYGLSESARRSGEIATAGDIKRVYATPGQVFAAFPDQTQAKAFWAAISRSNYSKAEAIMHAGCPRFQNKEIKPFDDGAAHKAARGPHGRVPKKQEPVYVVSNIRALISYTNDEIRMVGFGKAGWATCANILGGTRGLPQWVTRHADAGTGKKGRAPGSVVEDQNPTHPSITLMNQVDYAQDILDPAEKANAFQIAFDRLTEAMITEEEHLAASQPLS